MVNVFMACRSIAIWPALFKSVPRPAARQNVDVLTPALLPAFRSAGCQPAVSQVANRLPTCVGRGTEGAAICTRQPVPPSHARRLAVGETADKAVCATACGHPPSGLTRM